jgi:hypothetical protein
VYDEKAAEKYIWLHQLTLMPKAPDGHGGEVDVELSEYSNHFFIAYHFDSF